MIFLDENFCVFQISPKLVHKGPIDKKSSLVQIVNRWQSPILTNDGLVYWHINASFDLN